ncbi:MAG: tetratricopeptide repeat protein [Gemmatimonadaceae bacterium]
MLRRDVTRLAAACLAAIAAPPALSAQGRGVQQLPTQRVSEPPNWKCGVSETLRRTHAIDGLVCDTHFTTAAIRAAVQAHAVTGTSDACALSVAASLERSLASTLAGDTTAARRSEATRCDGRTLTRDSLVYDDRALARLCPGVIWSWTNQGSSRCTALRGELVSADTSGGAARAIPAGPSPVRADRERERRAAELARSAQRAFEGRDFEKAERQAREAMTLDTANADAVALLGATVNVLGRYADAALLLRRAIALRPTWPWPRQQLALSLYDDHRWAESVDAARGAIETSGESGYSYLLVGQALSKLGQRDSAIAALRTATRLAPRDGEAQSALAESLVDAGQFSEADAAARAAVSRLPRFAHAWVVLGLALEGERRPADAIVAYRKALELAPWDAVATARLRVLAP